MCVWDGAFDQPFWEREALQFAEEQSGEPDEIDLAPGTEPPPGETVPLEPPLRAIEERKRESRRAAELLWEEVKRWIQGAQRMLGLRIAALLLLLPSLVGAQSAIRIDPLEQRSTERSHYQGQVTCDFQHPFAEQLRTLTAEQQAENSVHEAVHLRQLAGNCDSVMAVWDQDFGERIKAEAEASCEGWKAGNMPRELWRARSGRAAAWWARFTTVGYEAAIDAFDKACGE